MIDHIKLKLSYDRGYKDYKPETQITNFLYGVFWSLEEFHYQEIFIRFLDDPTWLDQDGNEGFILKVDNNVELYTPHDDFDYLPGEEPTPSAILSIDNLKELTRKWKELYEKDAPIIYLIVQDNGWVVARETLDE